MTDLVERLRSWAANGTRPNTPEHECHEAADEIERLRTEVLEQCRLNGMGGSREAKLIAENAQLRAEVEQQRLELGITEDACGMLESEVKQLRARVAELEAALDHYSGGASEALLRAPAMKESAR